VDLAAVKRHLTTSTVPIGNPADFNRDGRVNALDIAAVKGNLTRTIEVLAPTGVASAQAPAPLASPSAVSVGLFSDGAVSAGTTSRVWQENEVDLLGRA